MAKYLGGTDSQQEEVKAELITPGLLNNDFVLNVSTGIFSSEKIGIKDNISFYEEVTQENEKKFSLGWGIVGLAILARWALWPARFLAETTKPGTWWLPRWKTDYGLWYS